ncbi:MFS transporter [bacterium]|nr:MFS transporter [bacterium]
MTEPEATSIHRPPNEPAEPDLLSFRALAAVVFQGAFSSTFFRFFLWFAAGAEIGRAGSGSFSLALAVGLPWLVFSILAGQWADRVSKRRVIIATKLLEVVAGLAGAFLFLAGQTWLALGVLGLLAAVGTLSDPAKYGLLPELLPARRLSWANGWVDSLWFLAGAFGVIVGELASSRFADQLWIPTFALAVLAGVGLLISLGIDKLPPAAPDEAPSFFPMARLRRHIDEIRTTPGLFWSIGGIAVWWAVTAIALQAAVQYGSQSVSTFDAVRVLLAVATGLALGCYVTGRISRQKIEVGVVPLGGFGMAISALAVFFLPHYEFWFVVSAASYGFFSASFAIPLKAFIQHAARPDSRAGIIGFMNAIATLAVGAGLLLYVLLTKTFDFSAYHIYLSLGIFELVLSGIVIAVIPGAGLRFILFVFANTIYKTRVVGRENIPEKGGALFVCNHMSFADALLIISAMDRPIRMLLFEEIYHHPLVKPFAKLSRSIPVSDRMGPRELLTAFHTASEAINDGDLVGIFAEGQITRTGQLLPFRRGLERIMKDVDAPIIPMHLDRVWGSLLSFSNQRWLLKLPKRIPWPVTISYGEPMPATATSTEVRQAVLDLASDAWQHRKEDAPMLHRDAFVSGRRHPFSKWMADINAPNGIPRWKFLTGVVALAHVLRSEWQGQKMVGICLPPSIAGAMVNVAALLMGKVPVNMNYTASAEILKNIAEQCELETVITSRAFLQKLPLELPGRIIHAEDLRKRINGSARLRAMMEAMFLPIVRLERNLGAPSHRSVDDMAGIIFSSGSTGNPKGVMLSHWNIYSNIEAIGQLFSLTKKDAILGILPFFHSFGFTATLFMPLCLGIGVAYHPNPLDAKSIGEIVERHAVTFMVATPTFLQSYTRRIQPSQFGSLQVVVTGAEKLREGVAKAFQERFGIRPYEGYGCTECSPVVAVNTNDFRAPGMYQLGFKPGKIGHPLPGVSLRIVDPASHMELPLGEEGLMLVKGPNVMMGYLNQPEKTAEVIHDGWYVTGDMAKIDEDGFVEITDRLSRFSKLAGEMVPHGRVEEALHEVLDLSEMRFAVTGIPDEKKGEKLVVLHTMTDEEAKEAVDKLSKSGALPNLYIPRLADFHRIEEIPVLGTGKMDLRKIKSIALEKSGVGGQS